MNGIALVLAIAAMGVDYQVETTADKQQQYTIQIEPELLKRVAGGEEIHSEVPADAPALQRLCIRIGMQRPVHTPTSEAAFRQLLLSASRWASADRGFTAADSPPTILWPSRNAPEQTYGVRYGWQPDAEGKQSYYVQLDPALLRSLAAGDEIYAPLDPTAGKLDRFIVAITQKDLPPRIAASQPSALPPGTGVAAFGGGQTALNLLPADGSRSQFPSTTGGGFAPSTPPPVEIPPAPGGFGAAPDYSRPTPRLNSPAATSPADSRSGAFAPPAAGTYNPNNPLEPRSTFGSHSPAAANPPGGYYPQTPIAGSPPPLQVADSRGYAPASPGRRDGGGDGSQATYAPGSYGTHLPPATYPQQQGGGFGSPQDNRLAMQPPLAATTPSVNPAGSLTPATSVPAAPAKETWGIFVVVLFALFFSIGGNLYLAWTALEFHNRYRNAIDRLRSAARSA